MRFLDPQHPMFDRLWVRIATVAFPAAWALVELWMGAPVWAMIFGAAAAYAGWELFFRRQG